MFYSNLILFLGKSKKYKITASFLRLKVFLVKYLINNCALPKRDTFKWMARLGGSYFKGCFTVLTGIV